MIFFATLCSYRDRYWRESTFEGVDVVRRALDKSYGVGQVSLVSASLRWLNHHSLMKPECGGKVIVSVLPSLLLRSTTLLSSQMPLSLGAALWSIQQPIWMPVMKGLLIHVCDLIPFPPLYMHSYTHARFHTTGVVKAFDDAWQVDKANCHSYFR